MKHLIVTEVKSLNLFEKLINLDYGLQNLDYPDKSKILTNS